MNSGLPSLLDAIFGKQDLSIVSLDEMYEVIREFPSFNAAHFLLAKKLKQQQDAAYEKEAMKTSLYFNNPFWLQILLDEGNPAPQFQTDLPFSPFSVIDEPEPDTFGKSKAETPDEVAGEVNYKFESYTPIDLTAPGKDQLDDETEEILEDKAASEGVSEKIFQYAEPGPETISSFDELMSKYNLEPFAATEEQPLEIIPVAEAPVEIQQAHDSSFVGDGGMESVHEENPVSHAVPETEIGTDTIAKPVTGDFVSTISASKDDAAYLQERKPVDNRKEIVNEYGIFEQEIVEKTNQHNDLDDMDGLDEKDAIEPEKIREELVSESKPVFTESNGSESSQGVETPMEGNDSMEDSPDKTDEHDYDSFDRPFDEPALLAEVIGIEDLNERETGNDADDTEAPIAPEVGQENGQSSEMQHLSDRFEEQQKSLAAFQAKNADSIVFTPYHMVDYFASQGIKLVLDENPPDQFGKQLKSFTEWLKVMKKVAVQPMIEKNEEKDADQVRRFAARSIQERDILTESMAEVLAKQGMLENAIALYQKLSLIYPPKSAYFAARIEQLKESLS